MAGRRKADPAMRKAGGNSLAQFGLMDMPDISSLGNIDDVDDSGDDGDDDLEAELMALMSGKAPRKAPRKSQPKIATLDEISKMANECTKDDISDDDEDLSGDEELVAELSAIIPGSPSERESDAAPVPPPRSTSQNSIVEMLEERLTLYRSAESAAKSLGDSSKARRHGRAIKTLEGLVRTAKAGGAVTEEDIPPPVTIPKAKPAEKPPIESPSVPPEKPSGNETVRQPAPPVPALRPAPAPPIQRPSPAVPKPVPATSHSVEAKSDEPQHAMLCERRDQYKVAALKAKRSGDNQTAVKYVRIAKQFDAVIAALESGQPIDLSKMPPPPPDVQGNASSIPQTVPPPVENPVREEQVQNAGFVIPDSDEPEDASLFGAPPPPATVLEALEQRLEKFCNTLESAKSEGNNSKVRRIGRIVKQYEDAIRKHKAGKPVEFEELPAPPGFGPIPTSDQKGSSPVDSTKSSVPPPTKAKPEPQKMSPRPAPAQVPSNQQKESSGPGDKSGRNPKLSTRSNSVLDSQLHYLLERQRLFKQAALESKNKGDIQQAKEYLRKSKGLEPMIQATRAGLPIDATTIPSPPQIQDDYVVVEKSDCILPVGDEDREELYRKLERDLITQVEICQRNKNHFLKLGDVSSASKFEKLSANSRKDLDVIKHLWKLGKPMPQFHYETRLFSMVQCNTDLSDSDIEITIERGINLPDTKKFSRQCSFSCLCLGKPNELDSYVKIEFPFPNDEPQRAKTHTVRDTNNPEFKETFTFQISRKSRSLCRNLRRPGLKLEVWQKGGFLRSDILLGTMNIKLQDLERKCAVHDSFDLMEGRKNTGGKLEVKVRLRDPLLAKQVEEVRERWLVVGS